MKRICPICQSEMKDNCYVKDYGIATLSYLQLIIKKENYKKESHEINACYCPQCGHIELYVDFNQYKKSMTGQNDDPHQLFESVQKYASLHQQHLEKERQEKIKKEEKLRLEALQKKEEKRLLQIKKTNDETSQKHKRKKSSIIKTK